MKKLSQEDLKRAWLLYDKRKVLDDVLERMKKIVIHMAKILERRKKEQEAVPLSNLLQPVA